MIILANFWSFLPELWLTGSHVAGPGLTDPKVSGPSLGGAKVAGPTLENAKVE
jgi:hypothetical protein